MTWSLNGNLITQNPAMISAQDLAELGQGTFRLTLTFTDLEGKLYRVDPLIVVRDWPAYDLWASGFGLFGQDALPSIDLDGDGFSHRAEFILGSNPLDASSIPRVILQSRTTANDSFLIHSHLRRSGGVTLAGGEYLADDVSYRSQSSQGLSSWNPSSIPSPNPAGLPSAPAGYE